MSFFANFLLQAEGGGGGSAGGGMMTLLMFGSIILVFYFFMIRPQQKRTREEAQFRENIKKGDKITTIGGIYGRVVQVEDLHVMIEVDNGVKLKMEKGAIRSAVEEEKK